jgi:methylthioribose-1-phosphate isomerase
MKVKGVAYRTIWVNGDGWSVGIIDQTKLPHAFVTTNLTSWEEAAHAIRR